MISRMDPVKVRQKLIEVTDKIARMEKEDGCPEAIQVESASRWC